MLLLTSNPRKYDPLADVLAGMQISLRKPDFDLPELQVPRFRGGPRTQGKDGCRGNGHALSGRRRRSVVGRLPRFSRPADRAGGSLAGAAGMQRLLAGVTDRARMVCRIGCWVDGRLWHWQGEVAGRLDPGRPLAEGPGPLTQWFVPEGPDPSDGYLHRRRALAAPAAATSTPCDAALDCARASAMPARACNRECVFCQEFDGSGRSIFHEMLGQELPSRVVHRTEHFVLFPPLGQFIEGGLLLATHDHQISMAALPEAYYADLDRLIAETCDLLEEHYGCRPLLFEHAPAAPGDKGTCCVDHAHLNIFPARVDVHARLQKFPHAEIGPMSDLSATAVRRPALLVPANQRRPAIRL